MTSNITQNNLKSSYELSDIYLQDKYEEINYNRKMGGFKPHFAGKPQDYYAASACDIVLMILFTCFWSFGSLGLLIGFLYWEMAWGMKNFVDLWVIVLCVTVFIIFVGVYVGGKQKIKNERKLIQQKLADERKRLQEEKRNH